MHPIDLSYSGRLGGLGWVRRTGGYLTWPERVALLSRGVGTLADLVRHAIQHRFAGMSSAASTLRLHPLSRLGIEARIACNELPRELRQHSYRTWMLGVALSSLDGYTFTDREHELFYAAALLHDYGLVFPIPKRDFTMASALRAIACARRGGISYFRREVLADAICVHPTLGITVPRDGLLGFYVQLGAIADIGAIRRAEVSTAILEQILRRHPRGTTFKADLISAVTGEVNNMPSGRFAMYAALGLTLALNHIPDWR